MSSHQSLPPQKEVTPTEKYERLKRIAAIHDISGLGKCSLTVALPIISATGVECCCIPTALLSTHTGEFTGFTFKDLSGEMLPIASHWRSAGAEFDGIYSGYLASAEQAGTLSEAIDILSGKDTKIIVDPVMADNGSYYSKLGPPMRDAFRTLCARAHAMTPNVTEAAFLLDMPYEEGPHSPEYVDSLLTGLCGLCPGVIAITGIRPDAGTVGVAALDPVSKRRFTSVRPHAQGVFYGAGDIFASSFAALIVRGAALEQAVDTALSLVSDSIAHTALRSLPRRFGTDFESSLPAYIEAVARLGL